tara:strand:+ start:2761 stop:3519 length:759 start_codon:yes stop_codon:yes gene_type:complete
MKQKMKDCFGLMKLFIFNLCLTLPAFCLLVDPVLAENLEIKNFGHSSLLISGEGKSVLLNPFRAVGCASGLVEPSISADVILASSRLPDEGSENVAKGLFLVKPGSYIVDGYRYEGIASPHDRMGGRRFGMSTLWKWNQSGLRFAHLGGAAGVLTLEDRLLIGQPDVLIIGVGGGAKIYNGQEAANIVELLKPKIVIPVQYQLKGQEQILGCEQETIDSFLEAMGDYKVQKVGKKYLPKKKIYKSTSIHLME